MCVCVCVCVCAYIYTYIYSGGGSDLVNSQLRICYFSILLQFLTKSVISSLWLVTKFNIIWTTDEDLFTFADR